MVGGCEGFSHITCRKLTEQRKPFLVPEPPEPEVGAQQQEPKSVELSNSENRAPHRLSLSNSRRDPIRT